MVEQRTAELTKINESLESEIIHRQQIEEALRESEQRFRATFHQAAVGIAHVETNGAWSLVNQRLCEIVGYTLQELRLLTFQDITHPDDLDTDLKYMEQMLAGDIQTYSMEKRYFRKDGSIVWINLTASLVREISGLPKYFIAVVEDISERQAALRDRQISQERLQASLLEKEVLLKEVYHRVKNNLQVISSLLSLQSDYIQEQQYVEIFKQSQRRIASMALVHEKMYGSQDLAKINFGEYVQDLVAILWASYELNEDAITLNINIDEHILLGLDTAVPCGLIIHELVSNSLKHAFPKGRKGEIKVEIKQVYKNNILFKVSDNGVGLPSNFSFDNTASLGWQLVDALVTQINGNLNIKSEKGSEFQILFSV
ncbi:PAS domain S-box protein [Halotia branconii]|uniref:PAS domain S-box protein n=1 Tax=Halotia branconii TaxID=1620816 RepID=UPI003CCF6B26